MAAFKEENAHQRASFSIQDSARQTWTPFLAHECTFGPDDFFERMQDFIRNPNLNTKWLFRADILYDDGEENHEQRTRPRDLSFDGFRTKRTMVRRLIPRNPRRDDPMEQSCFICQNEADNPGDGSNENGSHTIRSLVVYAPHVEDEAALPFYHPKVKGVAHAHEWDPEASRGTLSVHFSLFRESDGADEKLGRVALQLLSLLHKHGQGSAAGYVKRVNHDVLVPQARYQDRYTQLKAKYAHTLVQTWSETTDPSKHVFEDLGIAAFLIELWSDMFAAEQFPGFVDIGCGNGLLVHVLAMEGYRGWGFDARERKSWANYSTADLRQRVLVPSLMYPELYQEQQIDTEIPLEPGTFPKGSFIISNHADELTPWTPILAAASDCPFLAIPCCSHNLTGGKYRAKPPRDRSKGSSTYASLVDWVAQIAEDCGWEVETEMLRIPSTRNTGLVCRKRAEGKPAIDVPSIIQKYGGAEGFVENAVKLAKSKARGH